MHIMFRAGIGILLTMALAGTGIARSSRAVAAPRDSFVTYRNARFGFRVRYPTTLKTAPPPANGDGMQASDTLEFTLTASGINNADDATLTGEMQRQRADFDRVTYHARGAGWFVLSGTRGRTILYRKVYLGAGAINGLYLAYPVARKRQFDARVRVIAGSFVPGDLTRAH